MPTPAPVPPIEVVSPAVIDHSADAGMPRGHREGLHLVTGREWRCTQQMYGTKHSERESVMKTGWTSSRVRGFNSAGRSVPVPKVLTED